MAATIPGIAPPGGLPEVQVQPQPLTRFVPLVGAERVERALAAGERVRAALAGRPLWTVNSTATGGGVAEMLRPLLAATARRSGTSSATPTSGRCARTPTRSSSTTGSPAATWPSSTIRRPPG